MALKLGGYPFRLSIGKNGKVVKSYQDCPALDLASILLVKEVRPKT
jgi:hypothetical protein